MKNFLSLTSVTNHKIKRKIRDNAKALLFTSSIVTTIISMPSLVFAAPTPQERKKVSQFKQMQHIVNEALLKRNQSAAHDNKPAISQGSNAGAASSAELNLAISASNTAPDASPPPPPPPPPPLPPPPIGGLKNFQPNKGWKNLITLSNQQNDNNKNNNTATSTKDTKSNTAKTGAAPPELDRPSITATVAKHLLLTQRAKAMNESSSSESDGEDETQYTDDKTAIPPATQPKYNLSNILTPPPSPQRSRDTTPKVETIDDANQRGVLAGSAPPAVPPRLLDSSDNPAPTDFLEQLNKTRAKLSLQNGHLLKNKANTFPKSTTPTPRTPLASVLAHMNAMGAPDQTVSREKKSALPKTEEELRVDKEWEDSSPMQHDKVQEAPPIYVGKIGTLNQPQAFSANPIIPTIKPMATGLIPMEPDVKKDPDPNIANSGEVGARSDGTKPIDNRQALSDDITKFSSIDYSPNHDQPAVNERPREEEANNSPRSSSSLPLPTATTPPLPRIGNGESRPASGEASRTDLLSPPAGGGRGDDAPLLPSIVSNSPNNYPYYLEPLINASMLTVEHIITQAAQDRLFSTYNKAAIGSGDQEQSLPKHLWINGNYGSSKYNNDKDKAGDYHGKTTIGSIGTDIEVQENSIIGLAYNYVTSNFKYKNHSQKVAIKTHLLSLYGQGSLTEKLILQGFFSLGFGDIITKTPFQSQILNNKIKNKPYSSQVVLAHKSQLGKLLVIPNMAFKYGSYNTGSYTQNFEAQSLEVASNSSKKTSGIIGFGTALPLQITSTMLITPGLYVEAEKFFRNKASISNVTTHTPITASNSQLFFTQKPSKYSYKIGGNVTIKRGMTEIMTTYDWLTTGKKYYSHQGSIKLNLLF
ncbi:autotransporter domain-containing protein [Candidatus Tisiphia endosymbiont of Beris chalybata]|uniref:autotransporter domain-containing protein n=1 Tax=Candidatus Tisiphia endosymbiont of Beris chalybata TaxID=3066262 RepID=UPI00312C9CE9